MVNTRKQNKQSYQDFVIADLATHLSQLSRFKRLVRRLGLKRASGHYITSVRRVAGTRAEVTFELPPSIKQQMQEAIVAGKQIRLYVP